MLREIMVDKEKLMNLTKIPLHDAELRELICNYDQHLVFIPVKINIPGKRPFNAELRFEDVLNLSIGLFEPWGPGIYIHEVSYKIDGNINFTILLNSGDKIEITGENLKYKMTE